MRERERSKGSGKKSLREGDDGEEGRRGRREEGLEKELRE